LIKYWWVEISLYIPTWQSRTFSFFINQFSNNPLNCMKTFTYQGFPKFGTNILVGKKGKKPF
jgi:hypothetical protein